MKKSLVWTTAVSLVCAAQLGSAGPLSHKEQLGKNMYQDKDFSYNSTQSCQTCHHRSAGFADPTNARDPYFTVVSTGADGTSLGGRNAPTSSYTGYSPKLHFDKVTGEWVGGMFWDGRATGDILGDPLAEQAQGPPLNPVEMGMEDFVAVANVVREASYSNLFLTVYGPNSLSDDPNTFDDEALIFDRIGMAIAAYERSAEIQKFTSRYDADQLSGREKRGLALFRQHCNACHTIEYQIPNTTSTVDLFTSYSYANIGIPAHDIVPLEEPDLGLGYTTEDANQNGKFKIPTLRNIGATAPYGHNGYFPDLKSIVSFKNSRPDMELVPPEVAENISDKIGSMGMTDDQVADLVQFLSALTDQ